MQLRRYCALLLAAFFLASCAIATSTEDQLTPLVTAPLNNNVHPFLGTDGRIHIVYELVLTNASSLPATPKKIDVVSASDSSKVLASYSDQELLLSLKTPNRAPAPSAAIEPNATRIFLVDLNLDSAAPAPTQLVHHMQVFGAATPDPRQTTPVLIDYVAAPLNILKKLPRISPPLAGKDWVAVNGCCGSSSIHRSSSLPVNGSLYFAQRFAIDWMQLDKEGRFVYGDSGDVHDYTSYGANILAVADGTVVDTLNDLDDQKPGTLPDPASITVQNVDGNHVVLALGDGVYAFYAHMQKNSVLVKKGDRVERGQILGKLGNTGNSSGPHLHFHLMDSPSVLGSSGIPYVIDSFAVAGQISATDFAAATGVEGNWGKGQLATPVARHDQYPLDLNIINFAPAK